jgi:RNAse (barnase) inhibitor barstar
MDKKLMPCFLKAITNFYVGAIINLRGAIHVENLLALQDILLKAGIHSAVVSYIKLDSISEVELSMLRQIDQEFHFPDYFGYNWNAVDECIQDLSWLPAKGYCCFLLNSNEFESFDKEEFDIMLQVFESACEAWKRESIPFKLILC